MCHPGSRPFPQVHLSGCGQRLLGVLCGVCEDGQRKVPQTHHHGKRDGSPPWSWQFCGLWVLAVRPSLRPNASCDLQAGNVVTGEMVEELILSGADIIKVGIGPGGSVPLSECVC